MGLFGALLHNLDGLYSVVLLDWVGERRGGDQDDLNFWKSLWGKTNLGPIQNKIQFLHVWWDPGACTRVLEQVQSLSRDPGPDQTAGHI